MITSATQAAARSAREEDDTRIVVNLNTDTIRMAVPEQPAPVVNVTVPDQPAPVVRVAVAAPVIPAPVVNVAAPEVRVDAPQVTVETPDVISIASMPTRVTRRSVTRRTPQGSIAETQDVEQDA